MEIRGPDLLTVVVLGVLLGTALYTDLRFGKIYNMFTIPAMVSGLAINLVGRGTQPFLHSLAGMGLVLGLFLLFGSLAKTGGGDIKLMIAVGSLVGFRLAVWSLLFSAVAGGAIAVFVIMRNRALSATVQSMATDFYLRTMLRAPTGLPGGVRRMRFPYSPAIAVGTLLACLLKA